MIIRLVSLKMKYAIMLMLVSLLLLSGCGLDNRLKCEGMAQGNPDLYYYKSYASNATRDYSLYSYECEVHSYAQADLDKLEREADRKAAWDREAERQAEMKQCYDEGTDYNMSFDLTEDYGLTCEKVEYLNDHFILNANKYKSGSIEGSYSGFLSSGHIEGEFYDFVYSEVLATGKLVKKATYHLDCNNSTLDWRENHRNERHDTKVVEYYSESDFVMYYTNYCI